jgi:CRISPR-associated protein Cmr4
MLATPFLLHAVSPLHSGTGHAADVIDLPTARMKATGIPFVPGSSIKGVLRDACNTDAADTGKLLAVFGPEKEHADHHAGSLVAGDARLLAASSPARAS